MNLKVSHKYTHPILFHSFSTVPNCFEMLYKHADKLDSHSYEKNDGIYKYIFHFWSWKESHASL